jgi:hypothetical protein
MIDIPADATIRLSREAAGWAVSIIRDGAPTSLAANLRRPGMSGVLTHDPGMSWPDRNGVALVNALLLHPETAVFLVFDTNAEAVACWPRLKGGEA